MGEERGGGGSGEGQVKVVWCSACRLTKSWRFGLFQLVTVGTIWVLGNGEAAGAARSWCGVPPESSWVPDVSDSSMLIGHPREAAGQGPQLMGIGHGHGRGHGWWASLGAGVARRMHSKVERLAASLISFSHSTP